MNNFEKEQGFSYLDHTADVWVYAWGPDLESAVEQTALALMDTMIAGGKISHKSEKIIEIEDYSIGSLLVAFLSEFLYLFDVESWIFDKISVNSIKQENTEKYKIHATTYGEQFNRARHEPDTEVKAITYSYLDIKETPEKVEIKILFDI